MWHYLNEDSEPVTFSPELVAESSQTSSWATYPSALLKLMPMPGANSCLGSATDHSRDSLFGMMYAPLTGNHGEASLMSLLEDSPVRIFQQQERAAELKDIEAGYGRKWRGSFAKWDRDSCSWKTRQCSLLGGFIEFSGTWPKWGMMRNGECWERLTAGAFIPVTGFGLLHTPTTKGNYAADSMMKWECCANWRRIAEYVRKGGKIPTPTVSDGKGAGKKRYYGSEEYRGNLREFLRDGMEDGLYPNPYFSEWLMGWPNGWTSPGLSVTDKFQSWLQQHGGFWYE